MAATHPEHAESWALVERAQAGDSAAFAALYERYADSVFRFIYYKVGHHPLAEDLAGDVWVKAQRSIGRITYQGRDFGAWLTTIARNLVVDHFKSGRYRHEVPVEDMGVADRQDLSREGDPATAVAEYLSSVTLMTAVRLLNPVQQECIVLRFLRGLSVAETARAMDREQGAVKAIQWRAVQKLHALIPRVESGELTAPVPAPPEPPAPEPVPGHDWCWVDARAVREWAQRQGLRVGERGRVPSTVYAAYYKAATS